jgi:hypothetical protein
MADNPKRFWNWDLGLRIVMWMTADFMFLKDFGLSKWLIKLNG